MTTAHKLNGLGFAVPDEWIGTLILAGLPIEYRPMIMGIESSGTVITTDSIKRNFCKMSRIRNQARARTLRKHFWQKERKRDPDVSGVINMDIFQVLVGQNRRKRTQERARKTQARRKTPRKMKKHFTAFLSSSKKNNDSWYIDSCSSTHLTNEKQKLQNKRECDSIDITVANNDAISVKAVGNVKIPVLTSMGVDEVYPKPKTCCTHQRVLQICCQSARSSARDFQSCLRRRILTSSTTKELD